jgi:hypothetical protein
VSDLILSASSIDRFFTCPQQYALSKLWTPTAPPAPALVQGLAVHAIMAGQKRITKTTPEAVRWHVKKMKEMDRQYTISQREVESVEQLCEGIKILRRIDALGVTLEGEPVVIDYKTATYAWDELAYQVYPKGEGFQTACYLFGDDTPDRMDYLVSCEKGTTQVITTRFEVGRFGNLLIAAKLIQKASDDAYFPAHKGWLCRYCAMTGPCYQSPGWRTMYKRRKEIKDDDVE